MCFSPEKHTTFKRKSSSPVKLTKFQLKKNERTSEQELVINKRTKVEDPSDYCAIKTQEKETKDASAQEILDGEINILVNICGRIIIDE